DCFDLDAGAARERRDLHRGAGRIGRLEMLAVDAIDHFEVGQVDQINRGLYDVIEAGARGVQNLTYIFHHAPGLDLDPTRGQLAGARVQSDLAGAKDQAVVVDRLRVRSDRRRRRVSLDCSFHAGASIFFRGPT